MKEKTNIEWDKKSLMEKEFTDNLDKSGDIPVIFVIKEVFQLVAWSFGHILRTACQHGCNEKGTLLTAYGHLLDLVAGEKDSLATKFLLCKYFEMEAIDVLVAKIVVFFTENKDDEKNIMKILSDLAKRGGPVVSSSSTSASAFLSSSSSSSYPLDAPMSAPMSSSSSSSSRLSTGPVLGRKVVSNTVLKTSITNKINDVFKGIKDLIRPYEAEDAIASKLHKILDEIIQGVACAIKKGIVYDDLQLTVGIHPTIAQEFTVMNVFKSSGASEEKEGC